MSAHSEPVYAWGLEPCESAKLSTTAHVSGRGGARAAPRPAGIGRGYSEVKTSLISFLQRRPDGRRQSAGGAKEGVTNEPERTSSPAAASPPALVEGYCLPRAGGSLDCSFLPVFQSGMSDDLGTNPQVHM